MKKNFLGAVLFLGLIYCAAPLQASPYFVNGSGMPGEFPLSGWPEARTQDDPYPYTVDSVTIVVCRINFPDSVCPLSPEEMLLVQDSVITNFTNWSFGKFKVKFDISPSVTLAEQPHAYYEQSENYSDLSALDKAAAAAAGYDYDDPGETTRLLFYKPPNRYNSVAGPPWIWINNWYSARSIGHELGHALGLMHSKSIDAGDQIIGVEDYDAENIEYGNIFGTFGGGSHLWHDPCAVYKNALGWFDPGDLQHITESGTFKLYPHSFDTIAQRPVALIHQAGNEKYTYWFEYRPGDDRSRNGVLCYLTGYMMNDGNTYSYRGGDTIRVGNPAYWDTIAYLLDMAPNSTEDTSYWGYDVYDAALNVGQSFSDPFGAFTIEVLAVNDGVWDGDGWVEVKFTHGITPVAESQAALSQLKIIHAHPYVPDSPIQILWPPGYHPRAGLPRISIYSLSGKRIFDEILGHPSTYSWNGRDNSNRLLPAGSYLMNISGYNHTLNKLITITR